MMVGPLPLLVLPRGGVVLLADAARVALAEASSPPATSPAANTLFLPDAPAGEYLSVV